MLNLFREVRSISVGVCTFALMFLHIFSMSVVVSFGMDKSMTQVQGLHRKAKIVSGWWFRKKDIFLLTELSLRNVAALRCLRHGWSFDCQKVYVTWIITLNVKLIRISYQLKER